MSNTQLLIIIALLVLLLYYYHQNQQANLAVGSANKEEISKLESELQHYQNLYQKRVEKDIDNEEKITSLVQEYQINLTAKETTIKENQQTKELFSQKIKDLETSLINLAKQKIKGKKDAEKLINNLTETLQEESKLNYQSKREKLENYFREKYPSKEQWEKMRVVARTGYSYTHTFSDADKELI
ncbi:13961_t:CDS:1 [Funneliformis geosporum]|nr:13961_t:CDS:1 [Funneliformis geosporum]